MASIEITFQSLNETSSLWGYLGGRMENWSFVLISKLSTVGNTPSVDLDPRGVICCLLFMLRNLNPQGQSRYYGLYSLNNTLRGFPGGTVVENPPANAGETGSSPGPGRSHMPRSSWARAPQLLSLRSRPREPQLLSPCATTTEPMCHNY